MPTQDPQGAPHEESMLTRLRRAAGLTQEELAERAELSVRSIRSLERGTVSRPHRHSLEQLATALDLTAADRDALISHYRGTRPPGVAGTTTAQPWQLPAAPPRLIGRDRESHRIDQLAADRTRSTTVITLTGLGGVGKTALATYWGHRRRDWFPDGQLFANFAGYAPTAPSEPSTVLALFLRSLGVPSEEIPAGLEERSALFRSLLAGRQMLILLDNVRSADQVRPLLPGAPGCLVLITSRDQLRSLTVVNGAHRLPVEPLEPAAATQLLTQVADGVEPTTDPGSVAPLLRQCGGLPLALLLAGNQVSRFEPPADVAARIDHDDRLDAFRLSDDTADLQSVFSWSVAAASPPAAQLFRLLGLNPGQDISLAAAAALADQSPTDVRRLLTELLEAHLVEQRSADRYAFHDLLGKYASQLAESDLRPTERRSAIERLLRHYSRTTAAVALSYGSDVAQLRAHDVPIDDPGHRFTSGDEARRWVETELANLAALAAAAEGEPYVQQLSVALFDLLIGSGRAEEGVQLAQHALATARHRGDRAGESRAHADLGAYLVVSGSGERGLDQIRTAHRIAGEVGSAPSEVRAALFLGNAYVNLCRLRDAADWLRRAFQMATVEGLDHSRVSAGLDLVLTLVQLGRLEEAASAVEQVLELAQQYGSTGQRTRALAMLGNLRRRLGEPDRAAPLLQQALAQIRDVDSGALHALVLTYVALLAADRGELDTALDQARDALDMIGPRGRQQLRAEILNAIGTIRHARGEDDRAAPAHQEALAIARACADAYAEADALRGLSRTTADPEQRIDLLRQAYAIFDRLGTAEAGRVAEELAAIGATSSSS